MRLPRHSLRPAFAPTVLVGCALALVAATLPHSPASAQDQDAQALLAQAASAMGAVTSFHFAMTTPQGTAQIADNIALVGIEGDVQRPDRFQASFTVKAAIISLTVKAVGVGSRVWVTDPTKRTETWIDVTAGGRSEVPIPPFLDPNGLLLAAVDSIRDPRITGQDTIGGATATRVEGTFDPGLVSPGEGTPEATPAGQQPIPLKLWIDGAGHVVRVQFEGPLVETESADVVHQLDLTRFDESIDIQPPTT
jgi:hypothetical protein